MLFFYAEKIMKKETDVRILKLNKWYIPKTFTLDEQDNYIALGYFDAVQYQNVRIDPDKENPFIAGYKKIVKWKAEEKEKLVDYSSQEQMLFANIGDREAEDGTCFSKETIENFWHDTDNPYMFLSMIHINHGGRLEAVLRNIKAIFTNNYLSYVSFDYCDIVIFAKKMNVKEFLGKIRELAQLKDENGEKTVFDTFSMLNFYSSYRQKTDDSEEFWAAINLSVRDYDGFKKWFEQIKGEQTWIKLYHMFGRHDVSIVNDKADTNWLIDVMQMLHKKENQDLFWTFETYIKALENDVTDIKVNNGKWDSACYRKIQEELQGKIEALRTAIQDSSLCDKKRFLLPVCEVRDCICSIVKNDFSEEFIYCIYESFEHFITYMTERVRKLDDNQYAHIIDEEKIAISYDEYFTALNTLVNSTMHSERQFIQATAFNAIFYSVPPKIMAFYNAYIYRIKQILRDSTCSFQYSYLIYPSFTPVMSIQKISLEDRPPCDRLLTVRINEETLYDIEMVSYQLVHELAHYVGDDARCRNMRKMNIMHSLLSVIIKACGIQDKKTIEILRLYTDEKWLLKEERKNFTQDLPEESRKYIEDLQYDNELEEVFKEYGSKSSEDIEFVSDEMLERAGMSQEGQRAYKNLYSDQYCIQKCENFRSALEKIDDWSAIQNYEDATYLLKSIYSECYADLQMILVLSVLPEDYLNMFIRKHNVSADELLLEVEDIIRIGTVFRVMTDCGIWDKTIFQSTLLNHVMELIFQYVEQVEESTENGTKERNVAFIRNLHAAVEEYKRNITDTIEFSSKMKNEEDGTIDMIKISNEMECFEEISSELYEYLLAVMQKVLPEYLQGEKKEKIREIRIVVKTILNFKDTISVFNCIENEIQIYKDILFGGTKG